MATKKETRIVEREIERLVLEHENSYHGYQGHAAHKRHNHRGWSFCECVIAGTIRALHDTFTDRVATGYEATDSA